MADTLILLAEDDEPTRRLYAQFLGAEGYRVESAANGLVALEALDRCRPDLILLDIMMPKLDGIAACRMIRARIGDLVPIIYLTVINQISIMRQALEAGGDDYLIKSGELQKVLAYVKFWAGPRDPAATAKRREDALAQLPL